MAQPLRPGCRDAGLSGEHRSWLGLAGSRSWSPSGERGVGEEWERRQRHAGGRAGETEPAGVLLALAPAVGDEHVEVPAGAHRPLPHGKADAGKSGDRPWTPDRGDGGQHRRDGGERRSRQRQQQGVRAVGHDPAAQRPQPVSSNGHRRQAGAGNGRVQLAVRRRDHRLDQAQLALPRRRRRLQRPGRPLDVRIALGDGEEPHGAIQPTLRRRARGASSPGKTRLTPSPRAVSTMRMSRTRWVRPCGSTDAAWSEPHIVRSSVM